MTRTPSATSKSLATLQAALAAHHAGRLPEAERLYRKTLHGVPDHPDGLCGLGALLHQIGQHQRALGFLERAVHAGAGAAAKGNRASVLMALNRHAEAVAALDDALHADPGDAALHYNRGNALLALERAAEAAAAFAAAIAIQPTFVEAQMNRGTALTRLGRPEEALAAYDQAIALDPTHIQAEVERGAALLTLSRYAAALESLDRVTGAAPQMAEVKYNRAAALCALNRHRDAVAACDRALSVAPEMFGPHWNAAIASLALGDYARGWREYEWRWNDPASMVRRRGFTKPRWQGEDIAGATILLHAEQGMGDAIQFIRYLPLVAARGARIIVEAHAPLRALFATRPDPRRSSPSATSCHRMTCTVR